MDTWRHIFLDGEFSPRARLLSGLTIEQVTRRPAGASHSIYEELWHLTKWQTIVVHRELPAADKWLGGEPHFPEEIPREEQAWRDLVTEFLTGAEKAVELGQSPETLATDVGDGMTLGDELHSVAVHNAYHLGKILALRQAIGAWPPPEA